MGDEKLIGIEGISLGFAGTADAVQADFDQMREMGLFDEGIKPVYGVLVHHNPGKGGQNLLADDPDVYLSPFAGYKEVAEKNGVLLDVLLFHPPGSGLNIVSSDPEIRKLGLQANKASVDIVEFIGAEEESGPGWFEHMTEDVNIDAALPELKEWAAYARSKKKRINAEVLRPDEGGINSIKRGIEIAERVDDPYFFVQGDLSHQAAVHGPYELPKTMVDAAKSGKLGRYIHASKTAPWKSADNGGAFLLNPTAESDPVSFFMPDVIQGLREVEHETKLVVEVPHGALWGAVGRADPNGYVGDPENPNMELLNKIARHETGISVARVLQAYKQAYSRTG